MGENQLYYGDNLDVLRRHVADESVDLEEIHDERRRMGPVSRAEWKVVAIMSAMITLWIASTWLPVFDTFLVAVVGAVAMFLPGIGLFTWKEVQQVTGWDTLMVIGGVTSLGQASSQTGLATWLAESALGGLADWNAVALIAAISAFTVVIHLMLPIAPVINAVMIPPIMVLGAAAGVNPALYALPSSSPRRARSCCRSTPCPSSPTAGATTGCSTCCPRGL